MAKIIYTDHEKSAPYVSFHGVAFTHGQEVEVEDDHAELLAMANENPFFEVTEIKPVAHWEEDEEDAASPSARRDAKARKAARAATDEEPAE